MPAIKRLPISKPVVKTVVKTAANPSTVKPAMKSGMPRPAAKSAGAAVAGFGLARELNKARQRKADQKKHQPFRFRMKVNETGRVIILDDATASPDKLPFFLWEHRWQGADGNWDNFERCIKDTGICPLCRKLGQEGSYTMMLTVIDLRKYTNKEGVEVKASRKLFPVKAGMIPKYERLLGRIGNLRGAMLEVSRDSDKAASTGDAFDFIKTLTEAEIAKYGEIATLVDYNKAFPALTEAEMQGRYDTPAPAGSEEFTSNDPSDLSAVSFGDDDD